MHDSKRPGPQVDLAADGLPVPNRPLNLFHRIVRRACAGMFEGNFTRLGEAMGVDRATVRMYIVGEREPRFARLEALANYLQIPFHQLMAPHYKAIWAAGQWIDDDDPAYEQLRRNMIAAKPDLKDAWEKQKEIFSTRASKKTGT